MGFAYFSYLLYCIVYVLCDIFLCKFGITVLYVMYEMLDILIACMLGDLVR